MDDLGPDAPAFADFVRRHTATLLRTSYLLTGSAAAAEELVQDTLVRLYPKWATVAAAEVPVAYVRRAIVNGFLNERRRPRSRREVPVDDVPDVGTGFDLAAEVAERDLIWQLLASLGQRQRAVLVLRYFHDLDDGAIADALGCRPGTVRSLISRALAGLREQTAARPPLSAAPRRGPA